MYWHAFVHGFHRVYKDWRWGQSIVIAQTKDEAESLARVRFSAWLSELDHCVAVETQPIDGNLFALVFEPKN